MVARLIATLRISPNGETGDIDAGSGTSSCQSTATTSHAMTRKVESATSSHCARMHPCSIFKALTNADTQQS